MASNTGNIRQFQIGDDRKSKRLRFSNRSSMTARARVESAMAVALAVKIVGIGGYSNEIRLVSDKSIQINRCHRSIVFSMVSSLFPRVGQFEEVGNHSN